MKRTIYILALMLGSIFSISHVFARQPIPPASQVLEYAAYRITSSESVKASFTVTAQGGNPISGDILVSDKKFALQTPQISTWYDGKTQWAYSPYAGEVNISEPTDEELQQINPFVIITSMKDNFNARRLKGDAKTDVIELTPKKESDYKRIVIYFEALTKWPKEINATMTDNSVTKISIKSIKSGDKPAKGQFKFNKSRFPGVEIIDLR